MTKVTGRRREKESATNHYALRRDLGFWSLTFEGRTAILKHEQGLLYVSWLLRNPLDKPIHGVVLMIKARAQEKSGASEIEVLSPSGEVILPGATDLVEQRALGLDEAEAMWALRRKQLELRRFIGKEEECETAREEARKDLDAIEEFQRKNIAWTRDAAQKAVDSVRQAIKRLHRNLREAVNEAGQPHPFLRRFAEHLKQHLLLPSGRGSRAGRPASREAAAGCFIYEAPPGVIWKS